MATHPTETVYVGDDWAFPLTIAPFSVTAMLEWVLSTRGALAQAIAPDEAMVDIVDAAAGEVLVRVPRTITETIYAGRYHDALRITDANVMATVVTGEIHVLDAGFTIPPGDSPS
jgi:hypothetical protein